MAIGADMNDSDTNNVNDNRGHVRVFQYINSSWTQLGDDIDGEAAGDRNGTSVSLSSDGTIVAIGAVGNDNGNGDNSGHVRVFQYSNSSWSQIGSDIYGEAAGDYCGRSVSLSSDGTIVAIGAPYNDGVDSNSSTIGQVRVFENETLANYNICFPGSTPITTDQGIVPIKKINTNFHTIRNMSIKDITKTMLYDKHLVCFKANSLGKNIPSQDTYISKEHITYMYYMRCTFSF